MLQHYIDLVFQAFFPVLTDGSAIRLHPLVCSAYNADFDGDQMAVYVPLSKAAKQEVIDLMMADKNILVPASGRPTLGPTLDMVLGLYYLTMTMKDAQTFKQVLSSPDEVMALFDRDVLKLHDNVKVRVKDEIIETTVGRVIFNKDVPKEVSFVNDLMTKKRAGLLLSEIFNSCDQETTSNFANSLKNLGFKMATRSGITMSICDVNVPPAKTKLLEEADDKAGEIERQYHRGLITESERYGHTINLWTSVTAEVTQAMIKNFDAEEDLFVMMNSGARGSVEQMRQLAGMRGLMADPSGKIIDLPIKANFYEGLSVLEYFISTHGARKGRADTALRTADSGYLTRRLIDIAQSVITKEDDCGTKEGRDFTWSRDKDNKILRFPLLQNIYGRILLDDAVDSETGEIIAKGGEMLDQKATQAIAASTITSVTVRNAISCTTKDGICCTCYGMDLSTGKKVKEYDAVGIIAAQSIGEPGTQLTMRNFHTGGVAGELDITQGLPRVEELFEARVPKGQAPLSEMDGRVSIVSDQDGKAIIINAEEEGEEEYTIPTGTKISVKKGDIVKKEGAIIAENEETDDVIRAVHAGTVTSVKKNKITIEYKKTRTKRHNISQNASVYVEDGEMIEAGTQLTEGSINPHDLLKIKGEEAAMNYIITEIQEIYQSQGVITNTKHIEVIVRQMFDKVRIENPGDTDLVLKDLIGRQELEEVNAKVLKKKKGKPATGSSLMGITKAALAVDSFLSAASFQETIKILSKSAIRGQKDYLQGLKENLIIGKLIPVGPTMREKVAKEKALAKATK